MQLEHATLEEFARLITEALKTRIVVRMVAQRSGHKYNCEAMIFVADKSGQAFMLKLSGSEDLSKDSGIALLRMSESDFANLAGDWPATVPLFVNDDYVVAVLMLNNNHHLVPTTHPVIRDFLVRMREHIWFYAKNADQSLHPVLTIAYNRLGSLLEVDRAGLLSFFDTAARMACTLHG